MTTLTLGLPEDIYRTAQELAKKQKRPPEHIIPLSKEGNSAANSLALAYVRGNSHKANKIENIDPLTGLKEGGIHLNWKSNYDPQPIQNPKSKIQNRLFW